MNIGTTDNKKARSAYEEIIGCLIGDGSKGDHHGTSASNQFIPTADDSASIARNINAAFLISLAGERHPRFTEAVAYLEEMEKNPALSYVPSFFKEGVSLLKEEFEGFYPEHTEHVEGLRKAVREHPDNLREAIWKVFHPETIGADDRPEHINSLRDKRKITVIKPNSTPIKDVTDEVLFTANALFTIPSNHKRLEELDISQDLKGALKIILKEEQQFWYDHPVQIGIEPERNEIIYGLKHLSHALQYEKEAGVVDGDKRLTCVLSASVTHEGIQGIVRNYIEGEMKKVDHLSGLNLYLFTEADTERLVDDILLPAPALDRYADAKDDYAAQLKEVIGVDGRYERHYTFLKAISAFWQVFINPGMKATFKIDLDQIFPEEELLKETGKTAFQHLMSPLWGADGMDYNGNPVHLGMIAGALINQNDISKSIFTPDVGFPSPPFKGDERVFCSKIPQALSTVAEMMTSYGEEDIDCCIQRVHVTGGTTGIMIDALRSYRPFTPTFIGRAEDQAYLLSVLFPSGNSPALRYLHKDGFFMRHDKQVFAGEAIKAAMIVKIVGDYERILYFSCYASILPWGMERIKELIDPFTGSFVSYLPLNIAYLRLALRAKAFFAAGEEAKGVEIIDTASKRLGSEMVEVSGGNGAALKERYDMEKRVWDLYYKALDFAEDVLKRGDPFAIGLKERAERLVEGTKVDI